MYSGITTTSGYEFVHFLLPWTWLVTTVLPSSATKYNFKIDHHVLGTFLQLLQEIYLLKHIQFI